MLAGAEATAWDMASMAAMMGAALESMVGIERIVFVVVVEDVEMLKLLDGSVCVVGFDLKTQVMNPPSRPFISSNKRIIPNANNYIFDKFLLEAGRQQHSHAGEGAKMGLLM